MRPGSNRGVASAVAVAVRRKERRLRFED